MEDDELPQLSPKERVKMAVSHVEPDRPPIQVYLTPEMEAALLDYFNGHPIEEALEVDFRTVAPAGGTAVRRPIADSGVDYYDIFGVGYASVKNPAGGAYDEAVDLALARIQTMDDVSAYPWPSPDDYDYSVIAEQVERWRDFAICLGNPGIPDIINGVSRGRGMEQVLLDIAAEDEVGIAIIDKRVDFFYEWCRRGLEAGGGRIDILWLGEDLGTQNGTIVSPECFEKFFRPRLEKFINLAHNYGALAMLHSCGSTRLFQPKFIEMGLDILDSVQPEPAGMDPEELKREFGDKITYCGMISTQKTLPHGSVEQCRAEARHRIDVIGKGGGYIFAPAHCIQPDTPIENVLAIYEEAAGKKLIRE